MNVVELTSLDENIDPNDHDVSNAIRNELANITAASDAVIPTQPHHASHYYDLSSMAPLNPVSAVSSRPSRSWHFRIQALVHYQCS